MSTRTESQSPPSSALDPVSRISEILFGLIMVLTFTSSLSAATAGRDDIRAMLLGALGCNLVWGIIDALLFLMGAYTARGRNVYLLRKLRIAEPARGREMIRDELPETLGSLLEAEHVEHLRTELLALDAAKLSGRLTAQDVRAALLVFALVFLSVFPVVIPFLIMSSAAHALRVSNAIAVGMLFASGYALGRYTGAQPWIWGILTAIIGIGVVSLTIAFGG